MMTLNHLILSYLLECYLTVLISIKKLLKLIKGKPGLKPDSNPSHGGPLRTWVPLQPLDGLARCSLANQGVFNF